MIRARIRVDGRLAAVCRRFSGRRWRPTVAVVSEMAGKTRRGALRTGMARVGGDVQLAGGRVSRQRRRQAGNGRVRNRARASLNSASQGQRWGRCKVRRRAEWVIRPAKEENRRRSVLVVTICHPDRAALSSGPGYAPSPAPSARRRWRRSGPRGDDSTPRRT